MTCRSRYSRMRSSGASIFTVRNFSFSPRLIARIRCPASFRQRLFVSHNTFHTQTVSFRLLPTAVEHSLLHRHIPDTDAVIRLVRNLLRDDISVHRAISLRSCLIRLFPPIRKPALLPQAAVSVICSRIRCRQRLQSFFFRDRSLWSGASDGMDDKDPLPLPASAPLRICVFSSAVSFPCSSI